MKDCRRIRKGVSQALPLSAELEEHLFACHACRRFVRVEQILGLMNEFRQSPASFSHDFVERVMSGLAGREEQQAKGWFGLGVMRWAAVLMFSIAAGYGFSVSESGTKSIEWAASLMVVPSPITSMETLGFTFYSVPS
jgi:anti-sigma factor RsiW